jgi:hypothetical protein
LPDGSTVTLRFVEFQPPRGSTLRVGDGAWVRVEVTVPEQKLLVSALAEAWDGNIPIRTSFWAA